MPERFLLLGLCALMATTALAAPVDLAESRAPQSNERLRLACLGTMITADQPAPGGKIMANGWLDLAKRRVSGFGVGSQPIVLQSAARISFGSAPPADELRGHIIEGSIDRLSGSTRVLVRSRHDPSKIVIELKLDCEFEEPVS